MPPVCRIEPRSKTLPVFSEIHSVETAVRSKNYQIQIVNYDWRKAEDYTWSISEGYMVDLALSPRLRPAYTTCDDDGRPDRVGRTMLVPPGRIIRSGDAVGKQRSLMCYLSAARMDEIAGAKLAWGGKPLGVGAREDIHDIEWLLLKLYRELRSRDESSEVMVDVLTDAICVELVRYFNQRQYRRSSFTGGLSPWRMRLIGERVSHGPAPTVDELASLCGLSVRHLGRAFREETGQSVAKFVEACTLERASSLLKESSVSITEIASQMGFSSSASLAAMFRRNTGMSPSDVRREGCVARRGKAAPSGLAERRRAGEVSPKSPV